jgi:molybdate transport system substrate-binding protein
VRRGVASIAASVLGLAAIVAAAAASQRGNETPRFDRTTPATILAAASLAKPFEEAGRILRGRGVPVRFSFAGSQQLAMQAAVPQSDAFASADQRWMEHVVERGRVEGAPVVFAHNRLCVIVPHRNPARIWRLEHLARPRVRLVLAADMVPAGRYARAMLAKLARAPGFPNDYARLVLANTASAEDNVQAVVAKVRLGEADAGIVYRSDVNGAVARHVRVLEIPSEHNVVATYPIAVLRDAPHAGIARQFVAFLRSREGRRLLERHGFTTPIPGGARTEPR